MADENPNPGSDKAIDAGCTCPVLDNGHGKGRPYGGQTVFVISPDCPLHGTEEVVEVIDG